jgi:S-formylglutathione hydrolase FrmB
MALLHTQFFSDALGVSTSMTVVLPQRTTTQIGMPGVAPDAGDGVPVLYLLHGLSDDDTIWSRRTSIERYVAELGLAVVMPRVERSYYQDEVHGSRYWTFLADELPGVVGSFFRVSSRREDTFVAGLSMGGYGALRWALARPERFAAAASLSGALDPFEPGFLDDRPDVLDRVFGGDPAPGGDNDVFALLDGAVRTGADLPALYLACGTEDGLVGQNRRFLAAADAAGVPVTSDLGPGDHEWGYWDARIRDVLAWLPRR